MHLDTFINDRVNLENKYRRIFDNEFEMMHKDEIINKVKADYKRGFKKDLGYYLFNYINDNDNVLDKSFYKKFNEVFEAVYLNGYSKEFIMKFNDRYLDQYGKEFTQDQNDRLQKAVQSFTYKILDDEQKRLFEEALENKYISNVEVKVKEEYKGSINSQIYEFTKLMKYSDWIGETIETGDIYRHYGGQEKYLLCITPFCDTHRPKKVDFVYKFLVGTVVNPEKDLLKNNEDNYTYMAIPFEELKKIKFVKWKLYDTTSMTKDDVKNWCKKIATLKKEYVQNVINRYIAYQSRAGVNEIFYKESNYIDNFFGLFK